MGMVSFSYPDVIENQPYKNPIKVVSFSDNTITLENGKEYFIGNHAEIAFDMIKNAGNVIETPEGVDFGVKCRVEGWICGTPWAQPIVIPIFSEKVYKNRIHVVGVAHEVGSE